MATEKRLIDAEQAKRATYEEVFWTESEQAAVRNFLVRLPKVDAVEVVHGRWEPRTDIIGFDRCSVCHDCNVYDNWAGGKKWNYCPNCGAKMDGDGDG